MYLRIHGVIGPLNIDDTENSMNIPLLFIEGSYYDYYLCLNRGSMVLSVHVKIHKVC